MIIIELKGAEFFAYHGFYPEEQLLGNKFIVNIEVGYLPSKIILEDDLTNTVDYEYLHFIINEQMKQTKKLIETVAYGIMNDVKAKYPFIKTLKVTIKKSHPPLHGEVDYSAVVLTL